MNKKSRLILFGLILLLLVFLGLVFSAWVVPNLVMPAALAAWLFLRIFILSVDQAYYWWLLATAVTAWAVYRLFHSEERVENKELTPTSNALSNWKTWQTNLSYSRSDSYERSRVKRELIVLLTSLYASRQPGVSQVEILQALEERRLPLPDPYYNLLFPKEPERPGRRSLISNLQAFAGSCRQWYRKQTGQEQAEFNHMIDELIEFMENSLEG